MYASVWPRCTCLTLVRSDECRGVACNCCSTVQASRNVQFSLARNGIPFGEKRPNSSLTLSSTSHGFTLDPYDVSCGSSPHESCTRGGACVSPSTLSNSYTWLLYSRTSTTGS